MKNYNPIINNPNLKIMKKTIIERIASVGKRCSPWNYQVE